MARQAILKPGENKGAGREGRDTIAVNMSLSGDAWRWLQALVPTKKRTGAFVSELILERVSRLEERETLRNRMIKEKQAELITTT